MPRAPFRRSRLAALGLAREQGVRTLPARTARHRFLRARFARDDHAHELRRLERRDAGSGHGYGQRACRVVLALRAPRRAERAATDAGGPLAQPIDVGEGERVSVDFRVGGGLRTAEFVVLSVERLLDRVCRFVTRAVCELQAV